MIATAAYFPPTDKVEEIRQLDDEVNHLIEYGPPRVVKLADSRRAFICTPWDLTKFKSPDASSVFDFSGLRKTHAQGLLRERRREVISLRLLQKGWDGYGGVPATCAVVDNVLNLLDALTNDSLQAISDLYPNPHGTITIEWELNRACVWAEFGEDYFNVYHRNDDGQVRHCSQLQYESDDIGRLEAVLAAV